MPDKVIASAMDGPQTTEAGEARFLDWFNASQGFLDPRLGFAKFEGMGRGFVAREEIQVSMAHNASV